MNVSCPNIKAGGIEFGTDPRVLRDLVRACREVIKKPLWIKLTPNTSDIVSLAKACADGGADGLSIINTHHRDGHRRSHAEAEDRHDLRRAVGPGHQADRAADGLSGAVARGVPLPISGIGGIQDATDAIEFFLAGASTVQIGTQSFVEPDAARRSWRSSRPSWQRKR